MQQDTNDFTMLSWEEMRERAEKHKERRIARNKGLFEDCKEDLDKIYPEIMELFQSKIIGALSYSMPNIKINKDDLKDIFNKLHWYDEKYSCVFFTTLCSKTQPGPIPDNNFLKRFDVDMRSYSIACFAYRCREALEKIGMHSFMRPHENVLCDPADECNISLPQEAQKYGEENNP